MRHVTFTFDAARLPPLADAERGAAGMEAWRALDDDFPAGDAAGQALLRAVFGNSPYLGHSLLREPAFVRRVFEQGPAPAFETLLDETRATLDGETQTAKVMQGLRIAKRRTALLVGLADIAEAWELGQITSALSRFADASVQIACRHLLRHYAGLCEFDLPHPDDPERGSGLIVLGMGKLGAFELNYSSDIDLIVLYDHECMPYTGKRSVQECFARLTRDLVKVMEERTADGYVFRTDLRLRPDPGSTPPAVSRVAAETYYEGFGQNWERAAMIKARQVAGDRAAGGAFLKFLRPFVWRKSLDFAAIQDIHSIKRQINAHRGGHCIAVAGHNIKLGRGGIREIEFFAQTQQLIWGGREPAMRLPATCQALKALAAAGHTSHGAVADLIAAYHHLRRLEHRLQMTEDKQTQTLPEDEAGLAALAAFAGHREIDSFAAELRHHLERVESHYARLFEDAPPLSAAGNLVFTGGEDDPETLATIAAMGFANPAAVSSEIRGWHHGRIRATRSTRAREMLTEITPALLAALARTANPEAAFLRFDDFLSHLPLGVPVFSLLYQNPALLDLLAEIMGNAPRLADHLARHPQILDAVLTQGFFAPPPEASDLDVELDRVLASADDYQEVLDLARRWANDHKFRVGVQILHGKLDPEDAARALSDIADSLLGRLQPRVEAEFARNHGRVPGDGAVIIAMGKLGSREMTASSDLDLILIYDVAQGADASDGPKPLSPMVYFARLTQRLINALTLKTGEGFLYEVDMRLRPSGHAGPIATSFDAFRRYHENEAWTWEHMALTRARPVSGAPHLVSRIEAVIRDTLTRPRDPATLLHDVADMRERMAREHKGDNPWEVKQRRGGLVDIEFIAQYLQLRHAHDHPELLHHGAGRVFEAAAALGLIEAGHAATLVRALRLFSAVQGVLRQTVSGAFRERSAPAGLTALLARTAGEPDFDSLKARLESTAAEVLALFHALIDEPARRQETPS